MINTPQRFPSSNTIPPALLQKQSLHHLINTISAPLYPSDKFLTFRVSFSQSFLKFSLCLFVLFVTPPCFISHMSLWNDEKDTVENSLSSRSLQLQQSLKAKQSCLWRFSPSFNLCLPFFRKRRVVQTSYVMWWYTAAISGLYSDQKMKDTLLRSHWRWEGVYMYLLCHVICFYSYLTIHSLIYTYYTVEDHFF